MNRSGERKSSSAHYREKGAVKMSPSFILPPLPAFFWPREWKPKSNSQNEWWNCIVCTKQNKRLLRAVKRGPIRRQQTTLSCWFPWFHYNRGWRLNSHGGKTDPLPFASINTACKVPACIKWTVMCGYLSLVKWNRISRMTSLTKIWSIISQASERVRALVQNKVLILATRMANFN